ncbi:hypothetical protein HanIR_Chr09g0414061 [Helianthus annuus]|nr:hypothetical protein HanIR_Chr09g0414061 [Helianthus annuus]
MKNIGSATVLKVVIHCYSPDFVTLKSHQEKPVKAKCEQNRTEYGWWMLCAYALNYFTQTHL